MTYAPSDNPVLAQLQDILVGLANMLKVAVEMLYEFGATLIERANAAAPAMGGAL